ncbi:hypothetical protein JCM10908_001637 [Rhodotorula pacifica]|uniref:uncharacterized protein n=1 Tax=Rhodotorula pacifica TaxID=1495444 RepID=UPI00317429B6
MESLGQLDTALPPNELAEQALASSFRQAALSITALFKQGKRATTKAYIAGQRQSLQEVLEFMQAMLDHSGAQPGAPPTSQLSGGTGANSGASGATSLGQIDGARLINFICARQEALKAEEEDYDEEEASGPGSGSTAMPPRRAASAAPTVPPTMRPSMPFGGTRSEGDTRAPSPTPRTVPSTLSHSTAAGAVASGSSAPPSPTSSLAFSPPFTRSTASLFRPTATATGLAPSAAPAVTHSLSAPPASPSPLGPSHPSSLLHTNPPSPLGRPSRLHRDHHHHHPHRTRNSSRTNGSLATGSNGGTSSKTTQLVPTATGMSVAAAGTDESTSAGVKRRWAREAIGFGSGEGGDADVIEVHAPAERELAPSRDGMDVEPMADLEGWDGIGERPPKRTMRSAVGRNETSSGGESAADSSRSQEP